MAEPEPEGEGTPEPEGEYPATEPPAVMDNRACIQGAPLYLLIAVMAILVYILKWLSCWEDIILL